MLMQQQQAGGRAGAAPAMNEEELRNANPLLMLLRLDDCICCCRSLAQTRPIGTFWTVSKLHVSDRHLIAGEYRDCRAKQSKQHLWLVSKLVANNGRVAFVQVIAALGKCW